MTANPVGGMRASWVRITLLAWGVFLGRPRKPGLTRPAIARKSCDDEELNHERPARACQSVQRETVPNRENPASAGRGTLLRSVPRNHGSQGSWKLWRPGGRAYDDGVLGPRRPDSDVTRWTKTTTNAGRSVATGVVAGAWLGRPGISNAADWECGSSRQ